MLRFWFLFALLVAQQALFAQFKTLPLEPSIEARSASTSYRENDHDFGIAILAARPFALNQDIRKKSFLQLGDVLTFDLFDNEQYKAVIQSLVLDVNGVLSIVGKLENFDYAFCFITVEDQYESFSADIPELNQKYITRIHPDTRQNYLLRLNETRLDYIEGSDPLIFKDQSGQINEDGLQGQEKTIEDPSDFRQKKSKNAPNSGQGCLSENDEAVLDVMFVYTPAAKNWVYSNNGSINSIIAYAISRANLATTNNNMFIQFNLVHSAEVDYTEENPNADLTNITEGNGVMELVHEWRDQYAADFVVFLTLTEDTGGLGWLLTNKFGDPRRAFCLARVQQAGWTTTVIHEIGHNMGAHHHKSQLTQPGPTYWNNWPENTWSAGWRWTGTNGTRYCDLMTYTSGEYFEDGFNHIGVPYFSDPLIQYVGTPTGDPADGDNARTLKHIKHFASKYRDNNTMQFCSARGENAFYHISNVKIGTIDQEGSDLPYIDFTHCSTDLIPEETEELLVQIANPYWSNQLLVWIDWNGNGQFDEEGEEVFVSEVGNAAEYLVQIVTPPGISPGLKRMRIRLHVTSEGANENPCGESMHGTVHDYLVNITDTGCYGVVIQKNPENQSTCVNNSGGLISLKYIGTQPVSFQWQYLNGIEWTNIVDGIPAGAVYHGQNSSNLMIEQISVEGSYTYRCMISNCEGENVVFSEPAIFTVNPPGDLPATPAAVTGPVAPGSGSTYEYSVKPAEGHHYQWSFPDDWALISGQGSHVVKVRVGAKNGKVIATPFNDCGAGIPRELEVKVIDFCMAGAQSSNYEYIKKVSFNTIDHSSARSQYSDYAYISTKVEIGQTYPFTVAIGEGTNADQIVMWIDWNQNGNFTNPGERVYLSPKSDGPFSGTIKIPNHAVPGFARLRIRLHNTNQGANTNSCDDSAFGEVEDYSVHIVEACTPVVLTSQTEDQNMCTGRDTINLTVKASGKSPFVFNWQFQQGEDWNDVGPNIPHGAVYTNPDSANLLISGLITPGIYRFRCIATNCNEEKEAVSAPMEIRVLDVPATPWLLTGESTVCEKSNQVYEVNRYEDINFHWQFPEGWEIQGNPDTSTVTVMAGQTGGIIVLSTENQCGVSEPLSLEVSVNPIPSTPVISFDSGTEILSSNAPEGNQWHDQNGPIDGATGQNHVPGKTANYFTIVTLEGCVSDTSNIIHVIPSEVNETGSDKILTLFPNPTSGYLTITNPQMDMRSGILSLYNLLGQKFEVIFINQYEKSSLIDLRELPSGQYTLYYADKSGLWSGKFIKY